MEDLNAWQTAVSAVISAIFTIVSLFRKGNSNRK